MPIAECRMPISEEWKSAKVVMYEYATLLVSAIGNRQSAIDSAAAP